MIWGYPYFWNPHLQTSSGFPTTPSPQVICNRGLRREQRFSSRPVAAATSPTWDFTLELPLIVEELPTIHIRIMKSGLALRKPRVNGSSAMAQIEHGH